MIPLKDVSPKDRDAAKRMSDTVSLHLTAADDILDAAGQWCAFHLDDGMTDGALYPSKQTAMDHQKGDPKHYCYLKIPPDGITQKDAWHFLRANRLPFIDTTSPEHVINKTVFPKHSNIPKQQRHRLNEALKHGDTDP